MTALAATGLLFCLAATPAAGQCAGDCDGNGAVAIEELISGVNIALGLASIGGCRAMDANDDGTVAVNELVAAVAAAFGDCSRDLSVVDFVQAVEIIDLGAAGVVRGGEPPAASGGPRASAPSSVMVINGGSARARVSADAPFRRVFLSVELPGLVVSTAGIEIVLVLDYFEIPLPRSVSAADVQLVIAPEVQDVAQEFRWLFQVADAGGAVGESSVTDVAVTEVGTGDLQISVAWESEADVDLHVIEPSREEIYFGDTRSDTGGLLDLDALCFSGIRNENVTWEGSQAPAGHYTVRVVYYDSCDVEQTDYVVTVRRAGQPPQTFPGTFTGPGTREGRGGGVTIAEFDL